MSEDVIFKLQAAYDELGAAVRRQWSGQHPLQLTIPVNERKDTDAIIGIAIIDAIKEIDSLHKRIAGLEKAVVQMARENRSLEKRLNACTECKGGFQ